MRIAIAIKNERRTTMIRMLLLSCALAVGLANSASATSVRPLLLDEIIDTAATAFEGTCIDNRVELDGKLNIPVTYTTFEVTDVLKGAVPKTHVIKQIGGKLPGSERWFRIGGVPTLEIGQEYLVFIAGVSAAGFSSPIGLEQGTFSIQVRSSGKKVSNGRNLREMTSDSTVSEIQEGTAPVHEVSLEKMKQLTRDRVGRSR
jgi:hypothetical protein